MRPLGAIIGWQAPEANALTTMTSSRGTPYGTTLFDLVNHLLPEWQSDELGDALYLEGGFSNRNYRIRYRHDWYVLRVPGLGGPWTDRALEARFYALAQSVGRPLTAPVMAYDIASGHMITRWVGGQLLADLSASPEEMAAHLRTLHAELQTLADKNPSGFTRVYDPVKEAIRLFAGHAPDSWLVRLAEAQVWQPGQLALCHNDLNPWNLIRAPSGAWVTLDWEWLAWNAPLFDLVALHAGMGLGSAALQEMATLYCGDPPLESELAAAQLAFWLRETAWAANELRAGHVRPEISAQYETGRARLDELARG